MSQLRTLIIGLDGATFDLVNPLVRAGYLPTLARLMEQGAHGPLHAWPNMNSAAAWSSMITGYNPGQHGIYDFGEVPPQRGAQWRPTTDADRRKDPFWRRLSAAGQRVGVINVPITYPADRINGFMLAGMDTPNVRSWGFTHPPDLLDELRRQGIDHIIDVPNLGVLRQRSPYEYPLAVQQMVEMRARTILWLMNRHPCDALMAVFVATDRMQHHFWPDDQAPAESPGWRPIRSVYQQLDAFLGQALERIDESTTVLVVSDHGFGSIHYGARSLNQLFARWGLLHHHKGRGRLTNRLLGSLLVYGRKLIPQSLQRPLALAFPGLRLRALNEYAYRSMEWSGTQVFAEIHGSQVWINLQGRQPQGIVSPHDYHSWRERVRDLLLRLTDPATGRPVIRAVHRREELYHGPYVEKAAELRIEWDYEVVRDWLCYPDDREPIIIESPARSPQEWKGAHRSEGIFMAYGPHIKHGAAITNATIYDIAPTVLYLHDQPVPDDMDGQVLTDIFQADYLRHHPVQRGAALPVAMESTMPLGADEAEQVEKRLRDLGYIE